MEKKKKSQSKNVIIFRRAVTNYFKDIAESVSPEDFMKSIPILESNPEMGRKLRKAMADKLYESMCSDLEDIIEEGSLARGLDKVAELDEKSKNEPPERAWRPPGDVREHMRNLDVQEMKRESERLERELEKLESDNETMMRQISDRRDRVRRIEENIKRANQVLPVLVPELQGSFEKLREIFKSVET